MFFLPYYLFQLFFDISVYDALDGEVKKEVCGRLNWGEYVGFDCGYELAECLVNKKIMLVST